jgi:hypothetical protein
MAKRKNPPLTLGVELPKNPEAGWEDDDEKTDTGPVDDLEPIGELGPTYAEWPPMVIGEHDEEPTMLGPEPVQTQAAPVPDYGIELTRPESFDWGKARQAFIDQCAIALYARGYPQKQLYAHAARLWEIRAEWLETQ